MSLRHIIPLSLVVFSSFGCDSSFVGLQENNELALSVNGFLDVHADTQWVRAMPVSPSLLPTDPAPNGTVVHITRTATGETIALNDSLYKFDNDTYVWNYWTDTSIYGDEAYEVVAELPDGRQSRVIIDTPSLIPMPDAEFRESHETVVVNGTVSDAIIVAETRYIVQTLEFGCGPEREVVISHMDDLNFFSENKFYFQAQNRNYILRELDGVRFHINYREFFLVTMKEEWVDDTNLSDLERSLAGEVSNVEGGTGLVAGIARRKVELSERRPPC